MRGGALQQRQGKPVWRVCRQRWRLLLAAGCPDAGKPLPDCLGDWTGEHDMAECGQLACASGVGAGYETVEYVEFSAVRL